MEWLKWIPEILSVLLRWRPKARCLLVVEDNAMQGLLMEEILKSSKLNCDICPTAEAAEGMLRVREYPIVLIDMRLPMRSGGDLARHIRDNHPKTRIVFTPTEVSDLRGAVEQEFSGLIGKPITGRAIRRMLKDYGV